MTSPNQSRQTDSRLRVANLLNPIVKQEETAPVLTFDRGHPPADLKPSAPRNGGGRANTIRKLVVPVAVTRTPNPTPCLPLNQCIAFHSTKYSNLPVCRVYDSQYAPRKNQLHPLWWQRIKVPPAIYIPFEDANTPPGMRGVSLARLLFDTSVSIRGASERLRLPQTFTISLQINGYHPSTETISGGCNQHGPISREHLALTIARAVRNNTKNASKSIKYTGLQSQLQLHSPVLFDELRLVGLYRLRDFNEFGLDFFYVERVVNSRV